MKAVFDRIELATALNIASSIIPARTPKVILQNVKLTTTKKVATLQATDLECCGITIEVRGCQTEVPGDVLLPADRIKSIISTCSDQELKIEGDEDGISIRGHFSDFDLPGEDPNQFPSVRGFDAEKYNSIPANTLSKLIKNTLFAAASESTRYALTGVMWELHEDRIRLVATDGKRMAVVDSKGKASEGHSTGSNTPVVPSKVMQLLARNLPDSDTPVLVNFKPNDVTFKIGSTEIYGRLVEGRYPTYREVFPKKTSVKIPLVVGPLTAVVRQAKIMTDEDTVGVDFNFSRGLLTLKSKVPEKGRSKIELPVAFDGKAVSATFDPKLVLDFLKVLEPDTEITLELVENNTVSLWTAPGDYSYIVVPLTRGN